MLQINSNSNAEKIEIATNVSFTYQLNLIAIPRILQPRIHP